MPKKSELSTAKRKKGLRKKINIFLLIISTAIILFSQKLYAQTLCFIAYGDTRRNMKTMEKLQGKPDDSLETHFAKDRLELIDDFTLNWKK